MNRARHLAALKRLRRRLRIRREDARCLVLEARGAYEREMRWVRMLQDREAFGAPPKP